MRINVSLNDDLLKDVDEYCKNWKHDRSGLIAQVLREKIYGSQLNPITAPLPPEPRHAPESQTNTPQLREGFCEGHFEKGKTYSLREVTLEDENGHEVWKKNICQVCIAKAISHTQVKGGAVLFKGIKMNEVPLDNS